MNLLQRFRAWRKERRFVEYQNWHQTMQLAQTWTSVQCLACLAPAARPESQYCHMCGIPLHIPLQGDIRTELLYLPPEPEKHTSGYLPKVVSRHPTVRLLDTYNQTKHQLPGAGPKTIATEAVKKWRP